MFVLHSNEITTGLWPSHRHSPSNATHPSTHHYRLHWTSSHCQRINKFQDRCRVSYFLVVGGGKTTTLFDELGSKAVSHRQSFYGTQPNLLGSYIIGRNTQTHVTTSGRDFQTYTLMKMDDLLCTVNKISACAILGDGALDSFHEMLMMTGKSNRSRSSPHNTNE